MVEEYIVKEILDMPDNEYLLVLEEKDENDNTLVFIDKKVFYIILEE